MTTPYVSAITGLPIDNDAQLRENIIDLIMTPIGSRLCRRDYGCDFPNLIDAPFNNHLLMQMRAVIAIALKKWVSLITATKINITKTNATASAWQITIAGTRNDLPTNPQTTISFGV